MSAELRAAAKLVVDRFNHPEYRGTRHSEACLLLARSYLAEYPDDEDEQITVEWLRSIGFTRYMQSASDDGLRLGDFHGETFPIQTMTNIDRARIWYVYGAALPVDCIRTRGDVRRLCAALKIESVSSKS